MPVWFETALSIFAAVAAVFFFAKYRETAAALHESERMRRRLSQDLNRYRDVPQLRALRAALISGENLPLDDEGHEHLLLRDADLRLHHIRLRRQSAPVREDETVTYAKDGQQQELKELA